MSKQFEVSELEAAANYLYEFIKKDFVDDDHPWNLSNISDIEGESKEFTRFYELVRRASLLFGDDGKQTYLESMIDTLDAAKTKVPELYKEHAHLLASAVNMYFLRDTRLED
ncbi:hypothetical protein HOD20_09280 [archaeon]|jgi:hypothetical protein|nr:hypothetical protein [archaeon]MBT4352702.1 hypothetical protein [archaeon]MBT4648174.1 hypothetical protein [archaeon]MBT6822408.1 hypothetical protein [archaeon]MBT7391877.1 hypothetical protein [archaeon]